MNGRVDHGNHGASMLLKLWVLKDVFASHVVILAKGKHGLRVRVDGKNAAIRQGNNSIVSTTSSQQYYGCQKSDMVRTFERARDPQLPRVEESF